MLKQRAHEIVDQVLEEIGADLKNAKMPGTSSQDPEVHANLPADGEKLHKDSKEPSHGLGKGRVAQAGLVSSGGGGDPGDNGPSSSSDSLRR